VENQKLLTASTRCRFVQFKLVTRLLETRRESFNLLLLLRYGYSKILLQLRDVPSCSSKRTVKFRNKSYDQPAQERDGSFRCNSQTTRNANPKGERPD
jgi:hypothetical protein